MRTLKIFSGTGLLTGLIGFAVSMTLNAFVLEDFDAYGQVPVPGTGTVHLPAGEVTVAYAATIDRPTRSGGQLPVPDLRLDIVAPAGVSDPKVIDDVHGATIVNSSAHRQMWIVDIPAEGDYEVTTSGSASGSGADPSLTFGRDLRMPWLPWVFGLLFCASLVAWITGAIALTSRRRAARRPELERLAALRDSGVITDEQYRAEEYRILFDQQ